MARKPTVSTTFNAVDKTSAVMKRISGSVKRYSAIAGGAMAAAGLAVAKGTVELAKTGDTIAKTARKIGVSAEDLQELRFAADRSGVSSANLDKALEKLNKNVGDLRAGTGALTTYLNKSNPALADQLKNAESNSEAFTLLSDEISKIKNPMDRAALAQAAFGRAGQDLIVMAENGAKGIESLRDEAKKYGNIMSNEAAKNSEAFVDSMTNMKAAIGGLKTRALVPLIQTLTPLIQRMADWVAANKGLIDQKINDFIGKIAKAAKVLYRMWQSGLIPAILAGIAAFKILIPLIRSASAVVKVLKGGQLALNIAMSANPIGLVVAGISALIAVVILAIKNFDKWGAAVLFAMGPLGGLINFVKVLKDNWEAVKSSFSEGGFMEGIKTLGRVLLQSVLIPIQQISELAGNLIQKVTGGRFGGNIGKGLGELISRNQGMIESHKSTTSKSTVDVDFHNVPRGTTITQSGTAPGFGLNSGLGVHGL